jgi:acyl-CoA synthetase (AMP-forming)/AMP-acid ligase II
MGTGAMASAIVIEGLNHHFGRGAVRRQVLFDVALEVAVGEIVLLTGPSGSGKTTLLTLIGGLRAAQGGRLRVLGRADALIITGGEKVDPAEVAAALRGVVPGVEVVGVPHPEWGSEAVALYPLAAGAAAVPEMVWRAALAGKLAPAKVPKRLIAVPAEAWPRNAQGKVNRAALADLARAARRS